MPIKILLEVETIKWEMELLLKHKAELKAVGREPDYYEDTRLKELRARLDIFIQPPEDKNPEEAIF